MGFELTRLMKQYGVATPSMIAYAGAEKYMPKPASTSAGTSTGTSTGTGAGAGAGAGSSTTVDAGSAGGQDDSAYQDYIRRTAQQLPDSDKAPLVDSSSDSSSTEMIENPQWAIDQAAYKKYVDAYKNRLAQTNMYNQAEFGGSDTSQWTSDIPLPEYGQKLLSTGEPDTKKTTQSAPSKVYLTDTNILSTPEGRASAASISSGGTGGAATGGTGGGGSAAITPTHNYAANIPLLEKYALELGVRPEEILNIANLTQQSNDLNNFLTGGGTDLVNARAGQNVAYNPEQGQYIKTLIDRMKNTAMTGITTFPGATAESKFPSLYGYDAKGNFVGDLAGGKAVGDNYYINPKTGMAEAAQYAYNPDTKSFDRVDVYGNPITGSYGGPTVTAGSYTSPTWNIAPANKVTTKDVEAPTQAVAQYLSQPVYEQQAPAPQQSPLAAAAPQPIVPQSPVAAMTPEPVYQQPAPVPVPSYPVYDYEPAFYDDLSFAKKGYYAKGGAVRKFADGGVNFLFPQRQSSLPNSPIGQTTEPDSSAPSVAGMSLDDLMGRYAGGDDYASDLSAARAQKQAEYDAFRNMIQTQLSSPEDQKASKAEMYFRLASAFGAPTKTGQFTENLSLAGKEMADVAQQKREERAKNLGIQLQLQKMRAEEASKDVDTLRQLQVQNMQSKRDLAKEFLSEYIKSGQAQSTAGKQAEDEGFIKGTPEFQKRVKEIVDSSLDAKLAQINSTISNMSVQQGQLALGQARLENEKQKAAQLTPYEERLVNEATVSINSFDASMATLRKALALNNQAYAGSLAEGVTKFVSEKVNPNDPKVIATNELNNLLGRQAADSLKAMFPGSISNDERAFLMSLQGFDSKSQKERERIIRNGYDLLQLRRRQTKARLDEIKSGRFRNVVTIDEEEPS